MASKMTHADIRQTFSMYSDFRACLKGTKREMLHATHVKELIKTNYSER